MSIPKIIHYCWFGRNPKPELILKCIESWKKYCPGWEIIEWNEDNFDVNFCSYSARAYKQKRWGFVTDPIRFQLVYEYGGVYMDADAELIKPIDEYLEYSAFFGYATQTEIGTGLGFGAEKHNPFIKTLLDHYMNLPAKAPFVVSTRQETPIFKREFPDFYGNKEKREDQIVGDNILIIWNIWQYEIHHYTSSWQSPLQRFFNKTKIIKPVFFWIRTKLKKRGIDNL